MGEIHPTAKAGGLSVPPHPRFCKLLSTLFVRSSRWEARIVGTPTLVVYEGKLVEENLRRERITEAQVMMALRQHGLTDPDDVEMAVLEVDGSLSVVPRKR